MAEDALAEGTVGLDFYGAAVSVATEYVSSYKPVQMGLSMATILPVSSPTWASTWSLMWRILPNHTSSLALSHSALNKSLEFGEMTLSDYDSDEDADYEPSDSE